MPITQKHKAAKGAPRKMHSPGRKAKLGRYLAKSTCITCDLVFRTPRYNRAHKASGHTITTGVNRKRTRKI